MRVEVKPGKYIVAVSGGVDSMVLLDVLRQLPGVELVVAHFEHGVRSDSDEDRKLVEATARAYGLPFIYERGNLGPNVSEATARDARYAFLRRTKKEQGAAGIITAHHQDDLLETAILNMVRGTGRKGLTSLRSTSELIRPLLHIPKQEIRDYANKNTIHWREDSTNQTDNYLRNYIRHHLIPRLGEAGKQQLLEYIEKAEGLNPAIDELLTKDLQAQPAANELNRQWFIMLPYAVSCEIMAAWLRAQGITQFDRKTIDRLVVAAKVAAPGKRIDINTGYLLEVGKQTLRLVHRTTS
jgi:tRNA(Ile)-lysidine synthetase-like protein